MIDLYFKRPNYYKIDGCPLFMIYDVMNLMRGLGGVEKTQEAIAAFRALVKEAGFPDLHLQLTAWSEGAVNVSGVDSGRTGSTKDIVDLLGFDSITHYQFVHFTDIDRPYGEILPDVLREWDKLDREFDIPYFPHVSIGWDNNPRFLDFRPGIVRDNGPDEFEKALIEAAGEGVLDKLYDSDRHGSGLLNDNIRISVSYYPGINNYMDQKKIEFTLKDFRI